MALRQLEYKKKWHRKNCWQKNRIGNYQSILLRNATIFNSNKSHKDLDSPFYKFIEHLSKNKFEFFFHCQLLILLYQIDNGILNNYCDFVAN